MTSATAADIKVPLSVLLVTSLSTLVVNALTSSVGILLPQISRDTNTSIQFLQWAIIGYSLSSAAVIITVGSLSDMYGRRRMFGYGLVLYSVASILIALSGTGPSVVFGRCIQGLGAAAIMADGLGIITVAGTGLPRLRAVTIWSAAAAIGGAIGPLVGGLFGATIGWQGMFWTVGILAALTAVLNRLYVEESKSATAPEHVDLKGTALLAIGLSSLTLAFSQGGVWGWLSSATLLSFGVAALSVPIFVAIERRSAYPILDLSLLRNRLLIIASIALFISSGVINALAYLFSIYLQSPFEFGLTALEAGLVTLPATIAMVVAAATLGKMTVHWGMRRVLAIGFVLCSISTTMLAFVSSTWGLAAFVLIFMLTGFGAGMTNGPAASVSTSSVRSDQVGSASGISNMARYLAAAIGIAITTSLYSAGATRNVNETLDEVGVTGDSATTVTNQLLASGQQAVDAVTGASGSASSTVLSSIQEALPLGMRNVAIFWTVMSLAGAAMIIISGRRADKRQDSLASAASAAGTVHTIPEMQENEIDLRDESVFDLTSEPEVREASHGVGSRRGSQSNDKKENPHE